MLPVHLEDKGPLNIDYNGRKIRFVGTIEKPEWVAQDLCDALGIASASSTLRDFDDDEKGMRTMHTINGKQSLLTVYEAGFYKLLMNSRKQEAKKFKKWVTGEVLPSIRKHGTYPPPIVEFSPSLQPYKNRIVWVFDVKKKIQPGYWCVFIEGAEVLIGAEQLMGPANLEMKQYDLLDGSIGIRWATFRAAKPWAGDAVRYRYTFPDGDPRGTVMPWSYPMKELQYFKEWLHSEYMAIHFPDYIKRKYGVEEFNRALPMFAHLGVPVALPVKKKK